MYPPWQSRKHLTVSIQLFYNHTQTYVPKSYKYLINLALNHYQSCTKPRTSICSSLKTNVYTIKLSRTLIYSLNDATTTSLNIYNELYNLL